MTATIHRFRSRQDRLTDEQAAHLRQGLLDLGDRLGLPEDAKGRILAAIDRRTAAQSGWVFVMIGPPQNAAVVHYLTENSKRPILAVRLWSLLFTALRMDTGEICMSRSEMAELLDAKPRTVSEIMTELERINAITRKREGRGVRYFMNANVGTHLTGRERDEAQRRHGALQLEVVK